jgi:hypothetical protein
MEGQTKQCPSEKKKRQKDKPNNNLQNTTQKTAN